MATKIAPKLLVLVVLLAGRTAQAEERPCVLGADVTGEPALVDSVVEILRARAVVVDGSSRCGTLEVELESDRGEISIFISHQDGKAVRRRAADATGAATAIEAWARLDVTDPLLARRVAAATPSQPTDVESAAVAPAAGADARNIEVSVGAVMGMSSDGGLWTGAEVTGCIHLGPLCTGALVRYARDGGSRGDSRDLATHRSALDTVVTVEHAFGRGRVELVPGVGIGQRSLGAIRTVVGIEDQERVSLLRLGAHVGGSVRIAGDWSLRLDVAIDYTVGSDARLGNEGPIGGDLDDGPLLAGAPPWLSWLGLGVRYGGL